MSFEIRLNKRMGARDIRLAVQSDDPLLALFGPSGAGKTSCLNMIAGLIRPDAGRIVIGGEPLFDRDAGLDVPARGRRAGYVFQDGRLFPHLTVRDNLLYGHALAAPEHRWLSLDDALSFLGIGPLLDRWPLTLSGGEAQRVAIGRALLSGPRFLLLDEPLSSLDAPRRAEILAVILRIREEFKLPILYVSHDERELALLSARIVPLADDL